MELSDKDIQVIAGTTPTDRGMDHSSDSDSDEAPMEEGLASAQAAVEIELKRRQEALEREQQALKSKRKRQNERLIAQRRMADELANTVNQELEELPEELHELPDEVLQPHEVQDQAPVQNQHITFESRRPRRNQLKKLRDSSKRKGPVTVKVLRDRGENLAPARESNVKDRWLKRRSLARK